MNEILKKLPITVKTVQRQGFAGELSRLDPIQRTESQKTIVIPFADIVPPNADDSESFDDDNSLTHGNSSGRKEWKGSTGGDKGPPKSPPGSQDGSADDENGDTIVQVAADIVVAEAAKAIFEHSRWGQSTLIVRIAQAFIPPALREDPETMTPSQASGTAAVRWANLLVAQEADRAHGEVQPNTTEAARARLLKTRPEEVHENPGDPFSSDTKPVDIKNITHAIRITRVTGSF